MKKEKIIYEPNNCEGCKNREEDCSAIDFSKLEQVSSHDFMGFKGVVVECGNRESETIRINR